MSSASSRGSDAAPGMKAVAFATPESRSPQPPTLLGGSYSAVHSGRPMPAQPKLVDVALALMRAKNAGDLPTAVNMSANQMHAKTEALAQQAKNTGPKQRLVLKRLTF